MLFNWTQRLTTSKYMGSIFSWLLNIDEPFFCPKYAQLHMHNPISNLFLGHNPPVGFTDFQYLSRFCVRVMTGFVMCMLRMKPWQISLGDGLTGHNERYSLYFDWGKAPLSVRECVCSLLLSRGGEAVPQGWCFSGAWGPTVNLQTI